MRLWRVFFCLLRNGLVDFWHSGRIRSMEMENEGLFFSVIMGAFRENGFCDCAPQECAFESGFLLFYERIMRISVMNALCFATASMAGSDTQCDCTFLCDVPFHCCSFYVLSRKRPCVGGWCVNPWRHHLHPSALMRCCLGPYTVNKHISTLLLDARLLLTPLRLGS